VTGLVYRTRRLTRIHPLNLLRAQGPVLGGVAFMSVAVLATRLGLNNLDEIAVRLSLTIAVGVGAYAGFMVLRARHTVLSDIRKLLHELRGR
jgi:hypothetical protein